jgi:hypothetical protein
LLIINFALWKWHRHFRDLVNFPTLNMICLPTGAESANVPT